MKNILVLSVLGVALSQLTGCAALVVGGAATGAAVSVDRRSASTVIGDQEIELRAFKRLREGFPNDTIDVSATSYNRQVLLTGQVPDQAARGKIETIVRPIPDVRTVFNETVISPQISLTSKGTDASLAAMDRSLKEQLLDKSSAVKTVAPTKRTWCGGLLADFPGVVNASFGNSASGNRDTMTTPPPLVRSPGAFTTFHGVSPPTIAVNHA